MVKKSRTTIIAVSLAGIVMLLALERTGLIGNQSSNAATDKDQHDSIDGGDLIVSLNVDSFDKTISEGVILVDFWAPWCGPCRIQGPILEKVAQSVRGRAKIAKVNVDDVRSVVGKFGVQSIPTLVLFKDGNEVKRFVGVKSHDTLVEAIEKLK